MLQKHNKFVIKTVRCTTTFIQAIMNMELAYITMYRSEQEDKHMVDKEDTSNWQESQNLQEKGQILRKFLWLFEIKLPPSSFCEA